MRTGWIFLIVLAGLGASCSDSDSDNAEGTLQLIEFLESGKDSIPRNRELTFVFSAPVATIQDFAERLKIINVQSGQGTSNFARAIGAYMVVGERVVFTPRLPENQDRSDAGFRADANYHVFLKAGPDGLASAGGSRIAFQQEFTFDTSEFFEDPSPSEPPRVIGFLARDATTGTTIDLSRIDPRPLELALLDSETLVDAGRIIEPGAPSSAPQYDTTWQFDLELSEPIDPATVNTDNVKMFEIRDNALTTAEGLPVDQQDATTGHFGDPVNFSVPIRVETIQKLETAGPQRFFVRVTAQQTLVDNARYRIVFSGNILGIDFRRTFIGDNGLTGDGATSVGQLAGAVGGVFEEPGGLGYQAEFLVANMFAIRATKALTYDQREDGIFPERGNTTFDESLFNSALYNPATDPGRAVGFLSAFGQGTDGPLSASTGATVTIDTGDTANDFVGNPFSVPDINPNDEYDADTRPGGLVTYDSVEPFEMQLESLTVSNSSTLQFVGVNPVLLRVQGLVQIGGTIDVSGGRGANGGGGISTAGAGGPGGWPGGASRRPSSSCSILLSNCPDFNTWLSQCGGAGATGFNTSDNGSGPGRGMAGGDTYCYPSGGATGCNTATGGGGASHATLGAEGDDVTSANAADGSKGNCVNGTFAVKNSSRVGIRGTSGPIYGDRDVIVITIGGSGGGAGGSMHLYSTFSPGQDPGGSGGGGGGSITIFAAASISMIGGLIDARGGDGGNGSFANWNNTSSNRVSTGGGGGGSGGVIVLISGDELILTTALLDTRGGAGGLRATAGTTVTCNNCNAGGAGGRGFIFLMDADGDMTGFLPGQPGDYDSYSNGVLTIRRFETSRFSSISAVTELFGMPAADPDYEAVAEGDIFGFVSPGQTIVISVSSAKADQTNPLRPDVTTEIASFEVAEITFSAGAGIVAVTGDMTALNPAAGAPDRDAFVRVRALFVYTDGVEAALGPFAAMDEFVITFQFNGVIS